MRRNASGSRLTRADRWLLGWVAVNLAVFLHVALLAPSLPLAYAYNGLLYAIGGVLAYLDRTIRRAFLLGTVAGVVELAADHFLVEVASVLVYPEYLPFLLSSPLYMPLAWAIVTTQLGYLALRLDEEFGPRAAALGPAVLAMVLMGFYESYAYDAGLWAYEGGPLLAIGHAPLFIVLAEGLMFATVGYWLRRGPLRGGIGFGVTIGVSYAGAYYLLAGIAALA